ncbi:MAG TPA: host attachment protein [Gammaproteobacteria bacterium]|nr:host attachment protein [Gammaproteobacteria bacterium]
MNATWVAVADTVRARLFVVDPNTHALEEKQVLVNPHARLPERELVSDTPGRAGAGGNMGHRHALGDDYSQKQRVRGEFARSIGRELHSLRTQGKLERLYVVAEPGFLGMLRSHLDGALRKCVAGEIPHCAATRKAGEIRALLPRRL